MLSFLLRYLGTRYRVSEDYGLDSTAYGSSKIFVEKYIESVYQWGNISSVIIVRIGAKFPHNRGEELERMIDEEIDEEMNTTLLSHMPISSKSSVINWLQSMWLSDQDACDLLTKCWTCTHKGFDIINLVSNNTNMKWDIEKTEQVLGVHPSSDFFKSH